MGVENFYQFWDNLSYLQDDDDDDKKCVLLCLFYSLSWMQFTWNVFYSHQKLAIILQIVLQFNCVYVCVSPTFLNIQIVFLMWFNVHVMIFGLKKKEREKIEIAFKNCFFSLFKLFCSFRIGTRKTVSKYTIKSINDIIKYLILWQSIQFDGWFFHSFNCLLLYFLIQVFTLTEFGWEK